jgi:molybdopterin molybdotransferase
MTETTNTSTPKVGYGAPAMSVEAARAHILSEVKPVHGTEKLALRAALGRVLAQDIVSPIDVPAHTNSAVDGYALAGAELPAEGTKTFRVIGTAWAGRLYKGSIEPGECVRIMTGAPMPRGTDIAVMQEHVQLRGDLVEIGGGKSTKGNVRQAGEDLTKGQVALAAGKRLQPAELGLVASLGFPEVSVFRKLRVAFFSTGDELRPVGEPLREGEIYDSNRYTLFGLLSRLGVEILDLGVIRDERDAVRKAFAEAATNADAVITTGGVSVGEADYVKETLEALGRVSFWQIAMRPGRPLAFGHLGDAAFFGLPGNPVAVMVTFIQFVQPALQRMMGESDAPAPLTYRARSASKFKTRPGRTEYLRAIVERGADGELTVHSTGNQGSGILSSMSHANCFVVLPPESTGAEPGDIVEVQPFYAIL